MRTQNAIDRAVRNFVKRGHLAGIKVSEVSRAAKIYKSTFYNHHPDLDEVIIKMNQKMTAGLEQVMRESSMADCSLRSLYTKMLLYVYKNRDYYEMVIKCQAAAPLNAITEIATPKILETWQAGSRRKITDLELEKKMVILKWENSGILWWWGEKHKFTDKKITSTAKRMTVLAEVLDQDFILWV